MRVKLRQLRLQKGISQTHIAKRLGFKYASGYSNIEMGRNRLSLDHAAIIAEILGCKVDELLEDEVSHQEKLHKKNKTA